MSLFSVLHDYQVFYLRFDRVTMNGAAALSDKCGLFFFFPSLLMFDLILQCFMGFFYNSGIYVLRYSLLGKMCSY